MVDDQSIAFIDSNQNVSTHKNVENEENFNTDVFLNSESSLLHVNKVKAIKIK